MRSKIEYAEFEGGIKIINYPEGFRANEGINEQDLEIRCRCFDEHISSTFVAGVHIEQRDVKVYQPFALKVTHDFPFLKMQFEVRGFSDFASSLSSVMDVQITANHHQLFFIPEVRGELNYVHDRNTLEIKLTVDYLKQLFGEDLSTLGRFGRAILTNNPVMINSARLPITAAMHHVIAQIRTCHYSGIMRKIFLEGKVAELLLLQLDQVNTVENFECLKPRQSDIEKLHYARELIEANIKNPKTIIQLSQLTGINDFKLKRDFKRIFGKTIFEYLTEYRLNKAREMLQEGYLINEIAYNIGYKHPQHFSAAFKRYFGICPSEIKIA